MTLFETLSSIRDPRRTVGNNNTSSQYFEATISFYSNKTGIIDSIASYNKRRERA